MDIASQPRKKAYKGLPMEGVIATWYARNTGGDLAPFAADAARIAARLAPGARVLEIAPGPGYLAIALARLGDFAVCGLDISRSFVRIATENAVRAGVGIDFRHGDAAASPFATESFDFIVCRAAFKNFSDPSGALGEMHRMLRPGGEALIIDMSRDASDADIDEVVETMKLGPVDAMVTRAIFKHPLRKSAYTRSILSDGVRLTLRRRGDQGGVDRHGGVAAQIATTHGSPSIPPRPLPFAFCSAAHVLRSRGNGVSNRSADTLISPIRSVRKWRKPSRSSHQATITRTASK